MFTRRNCIFSYLPCLLLSFTLLSGCGGKTNNNTQQGKGIHVVCTTGQVADIVKNIGKDHVNVEALMGPGIDPHLYSSTATDANKLIEADMIFYSGQGLESTSMKTALENVKKEGKSVHEVTRDLPKEKLLEADEGKVDPHIWHNLELWADSANVVYEELAKLKPELKEELKKNLEAYQKRLTDLHNEVKKAISEIPENQRVLVTAHDAFSYYAKAYGLTVKSLQGISTESDVSVKTVNDLVQFITDNKIKAIFVEKSVSNKNIQSLQEGCEKKGHQVVIGGELFSDTLGETGDTTTLEGSIKHNTDAIVKALK